MFNDFVSHAISDGETDFEYATCGEAQLLLTQLNLDIEGVIQTHGAEATGTAVWYAYGCVSGMIHDVLNPSVADGFGDFYSSMRSLYENGFARHCDNSPQFSRCSGNLNTACYMLWDMDGIEYLTFDESCGRLQYAEPLIEFGLCHQHPAVQTSFLHCLGHQRDQIPDFVDPRLSEFLKRQDVAQEVRAYAEHCKSGMIL